MRATQNGPGHHASPVMGPDKTPRSGPARGHSGWAAMIACLLWSGVGAGAHADAANAGAHNTGEWTVVRGSDPILDIPTVTATLSAAPVPGKPELRPNLHIACTDGTLNASIRWDTGTNGTWTGQTPQGIDVLVRLGEQEPEWRRWKQIGRTPATELDEPGKFITELASHRRLAVRAYPVGTAPATVVFDLSDAGAVMTEVTNACRLFAKRMEGLTGAGAELRSRAEAELRRVEDERRRADAERSRIEAEKRKAEAERKRIEAAENKAEAERRRIEAEKKKAEAERRRIEAAKKRAEAERKRIEEARRKEAEQALQEATARDARELEKEQLTRLNAGRLEYIAQIKGRIRRNWLRPPGTGVGLKCVVRIGQIPGGKWSRPKCCAAAATLHSTDRWRRRHCGGHSDGNPDSPMDSRRLDVDRNPDGDGAKLRGASRNRSGRKRPGMVARLVAEPALCLDARRLHQGVMRMQ